MQARLMMMGVLLLLMMDPVQGQYEYAAACIPNLYDGDPFYRCRLSIIGKTTSQIEVHTVTESINFTLPAGDVYEREFGREVIPILGTDSKAMRVVSSQEVQVLVYKGRNIVADLQDVYMVPNQLRSIHEYYTSAYYNPDMPECGSTHYKQFYLVASFDDDTSIHVEQQDGTTYDETLPAFGTFLQMTTSSDDHLAMGTRITASKPITVVAGNLCMRNIEDWGEAYASSIPDIASLGHEYIVPHITSDDSDNPAGYSVGVVATEDDTIVISNEDMEVLNAGKSTLFEYPYYAESIFVNCSKPCLVVQYTRGIREEYGLFMQNILPLEQFSTSAFFTTLDTQPTSYLSLVLHGESPGNFLFLDGNSLGYLDWKPINGYTSTQLAITAGAHDLVSNDDRPFAAYVYVQEKYNLAASGYALLPSESSRVTTTTSTTTTTTTSTIPSTPTTTESPTSTPSPSVNGTLPQHTVRVNGTAFPTDGADISPACSVTHLNSLRGKNLQMIVAVNEAIGKTICLEIGDLLDVSSAEGMSVQDNKALLVIDHFLKVEWHHVAAEVETCALEVAEYLNHLSNWQQPIFPGDADCGPLDVRPPYLNTSSTVWTCDNQKDAEMDSSNSLVYASKVSEVLRTIDGSVLEPECTFAYLNESKKKTTSMMEEISSVLPTFDCGDIVTPVTNTVSLVGAGNQAYFVASFFYIPSPVASFAEFVACMQEVHAFCMHHHNWNPGSQPGDPFLPVPPGCPALEHDTDTLDDEGHRWACV